MSSEPRGRRCPPDEAGSRSACLGGLARRRKIRRNQRPAKSANPASKAAKVVTTAGPVPSGCAGPPPMLATGAIGPVPAWFVTGVRAATVTRCCFVARALAGVGAAKADHTGAGPGSPAGQELGAGLGDGLGVRGGWLLCVRLGVGLGLGGGDEERDGDGLGLGEVGDGVGAGDVGEGVGVGDVGEGVGVGEVADGVGLGAGDEGSGVGDADVGLGLGVGVTAVAAQAAGENATVPATIRPGTTICRTLGMQRRGPAPGVGRGNLALEMMASIMTLAPALPATRTASSRLNRRTSCKRIIRTYQVNGSRRAGTTHMAWV